MDKVILYGAGYCGKRTYEFLKFQGLAGIVYSFCDKNPNIAIDEKPVLQYEDVKNMKIPFIICADVGSDTFSEIRDLLVRDGKEWYKDIHSFEEKNGFDMGRFERDFIVYSHRNNDWFDKAENAFDLDVFWNPDTVFYKLFKQLDLHKTIEFACGHGRHVKNYIDKTQELILVDGLEENITFCQKRFKNYNNIQYYHNNKKDLAELSNCCATCLFSYDSMVHFDIINIYEYLMEFYRVLVKGGMALIHHSNLHSNYKISFATGIHNRNYMDSGLFAHMAFSLGFIVLDQVIVDWYGVKNLDCLTLLQK